MVLLVGQWILWMLVGAIIGGAASVIARRKPDEPRSNRPWERLALILSGMFGAVVGGTITDIVLPTMILDFNLSTLVGSVIGAAVALLALYLSNRSADKVHNTHNTTERRFSTSEQKLDVADTSDRNNWVRFGRVRIPSWVIMAATLLLLPAHILLLIIGIPDITTAPPPWGTVATFSNEYGQLNYLTYTPPSYREGTDLPLVILLHGCTQTPYLLEAAAGMRSVADENSLILVYPQQNAASSPHRCWNWYDKRNQLRDSGELSLLAGIVNEVVQQYSVDERRVYVAGISSGGAMTSILGSCYRDVFAAAAVHSGMGYESANSVFQALVAPLRGNQVPPDVAGQDAYRCAGDANRPIPVLVLHGTADTIVFPVNGDHTLEQFAQMNDFAHDGQDNDSISSSANSSRSEQVQNGYTYTVEDYQLNGQLLMQHYTVNGLQHMWSGGTGIPPLSDPKAPNASVIFWEFFRTHTLP
jgi:poly(hydroxyalkanoate) depolymerase family esterase